MPYLTLAKIAAVGILLTSCFILYQRGNIWHAKALQYQSQVLAANAATTLAKQECQTETALAVNQANAIMQKQIDQYQTQAYAATSAAEASDQVSQANAAQDQNQISIEVQAKPSDNGPLAPVTSRYIAYLNGRGAVQ